MENDYIGVVAGLPAAYSERTRRYVTAPSRLAGVEPSQAVKTALRLFVTGACRSKKEAARAVGLHPAYFVQLTNESEPVRKMLDELDAHLLGKTTDMSVLMQQLGRMAVGRIARLALTGGNERIQLDAAKTLADRSPETAGIQKIQDAGLSLGSEDAKAIAAALIESAKLAADFEKVGVEGLVEVDITQGASSGVPALPAPKGSTGESSDQGQGSSDNGSTGDQGNVQERSQLRLLE